jgi:putative DNA primase/helicase
MGARQPNVVPFPQLTADKIIQLQGRKVGGKTLCPICRKRSLSVSQDGNRALVQCMRGCDQDAVWKALCGAAGIVTGKRQRDRSEPEKTKSRNSVRDIVDRIEPIDDRSRADEYLYSRGITMKLDGLPIHYDPQTKAAVFIATDAAGKPQFVHNIYLTPKGEKRGTQNLPNAKRTIGAMSGAAVKFTGDKSRLILAEGTETGLSIHQATGYEVWACCGQVFTIAPLPPKSDVIIARDWHSPGTPADDMLIRQATELVKVGHKVRIATPPDPNKDGWDFNDTLREDGEEVIREAIDTAKPFVRESGLAVTKFSAIDMEPVEWLWQDTFPMGALSIIAGKPDRGKSTLLMDIAARVTTAKPWPLGRSRAPLGDVIVLGAEDPQKMLAARFAAAGGDPDRAHYVGMMVDDEDAHRQRMISLSHDIERLAIEIKKRKTKVVIIDPLSSYLGNVDAWRDNQLRAVLSPVANLAEELDVAVISSMHLNKRQADGGDAMERVLGSIGFVGAARATFLVEDDPSELGQLDHVKLFLPIKCNWVAPGNLTRLSFEVRGCEIAEGINVGRIEWTGRVTDTADDVLKPMAKERAVKRAEAEQFLFDTLVDGPMAVKELQKCVTNAGLSWETVKTARQKTKERARKDAKIAEYIEAAPIPGKAAAGWEWFIQDARVLHKDRDE